MTQRCLSKRLKKTAQIQPPLENIFASAPGLTSGCLLSLWLVFQLRALAGLPFSTASAFPLSSLASLLFLVSSSLLYKAIYTKITAISPSTFGKHAFESMFERCIVAYFPFAFGEGGDVDVALSDL
jgi:hypothetical protein